MADWRRRFDEERISTDADEAEWRAVRFETANIDSGAWDEQLGAEFGSQEFDETTDCEFRTGQIADEIKRRTLLLGGCYPFSTDRNSIRHTPSRTGAYEFCLATSFVQNISTIDGRRFQIAFERLTRDTLVCFLGGPAGVAAFRTGMPGDNLEERPTAIKDIVQSMSGEAGEGEWRWQLEEGHPDEPASQDLGDLGMDVVAWRALPDNRGGHLFFIGQCACGLSDCDSKLEEPNRGRLKSWLKVGDVPFAKVFAVPFHIPNDPYLREISRMAEAVTFDRARIALIAETGKSAKHIQHSAGEGYFDLVDAALSGGSTAVRARRQRRRRGAGGRRSQSP